jgi:predicted dehydrogenase
MDKIRWGILGTGGIANTFAKGLSVLPDAELVAVGSRKQETADVFANKYNIPHRHPSYEALANDPDVDAIYVCTPHPMHKDAVMVSLKGGKAVLCEKPFTLNAAEAQEVITYARQHKLFLMEAMWTRFLPVMGKVRELVAQGAIGDVRAVMADFGFRTDFNPSSRLLAPELGGGALLDVGVYVTSFASMVLGGKVAPRIVSLADLGQTGVDEQSAFILGYPQGRLAMLFSAVRTESPHEAIVMGENGRIKVHAQFYHSTRLTLSVRGQEDQVIDVPYEGNGFNYEIAEVMRCLRAGKLESDILPLDETLAIMQTLDAIRAPWGLKYPTES